MTLGQISYCTSTKTPTAKLRKNMFRSMLWKVVQGDELGLTWNQVPYLNGGMYVPRKYYPKRKKVCMENI